MRDRKAYLRDYRASHLEQERERKRKSYLKHQARYREAQRAAYVVYSDWLRVTTATWPCVECGCVAELWHHTDPATKRMAVSAMYSMALDSIKAELDKCVPMCFACHMSLHRKKECIGGGQKCA